jgi:hypothetical protein
MKGQLSAHNAQQRQYKLLSNEDREIKKLTAKIFQCKARLKYLKSTTIKKLKSLKSLNEQILIKEKLLENLIIERIRLKEIKEKDDVNRN